MDDGNVDEGGGEFDRRRYNVSQSFLLNQQRWDAFHQLPLVYAMPIPLMVYRAC